MHRRLAALLAVTGALAVPAVADAAVHRLSLRAADRVADRLAGHIADTWVDETDVTIDGYDLADCERDTRRRADCDVTFYLADGAECDDTLHVRLTGRGRLVVTADSGTDADRAFEDCTDPAEEDPAADDFGDDEGDDLGDDPAAEDEDF